MNKISDRPTLIVDAMGGDYAPDEIVKGAVEGKELTGSDLVLVGSKNKIIDVLSKYCINTEGINIINSSDDISMDDSPSDVIKRKKNSSIYIGTDLAARTKKSAFISAGNTGAVMACSLFNMKRIESIQRPAIAVVIPLGESKFVLIDAGANVEVKPVYFKQFAVMGDIYCRELMGISNPRIGLLNVGTEKKKGSEIIIEAHDLLENANINFIGNVEGRDIFDSKADVVVCDGFIGNILLKAFEGMAKFFFKEIKNVLTSNFLTKLSALFLKKDLKLMKKKFDYEEYGGALLLGVDGLSIISHGSSRAKAIKSALKFAGDAMRSDILKKIKEEINK
ncbi:MAG: phosphate acyltransferase PlsX [Actinobacteria bacterium]|nr:phosphate acyltransferase PlsX [Actinomycetota bacterium]MBM3712055.1 phosphate acyltransferase PlsX [Actinomycetota bacterium]